MRSRVSTFFAARHRDESGVVAVLVAILVVVLVVITAFTLDFGLAFDSKRELQNASDAAALAGAATYADDAVSCPGATLTADAENEADSYRIDNRPGSTRAAMSAACNAMGSIEVGYSSTGDTPVAFGGPAGASGPYTTERSAVATVGVAGSLTGLRPFAICAAAIPAALPTGLVFVDYDAFHSTGQCPEAHMNGNWWSLDCPSDPSEPPGGGTNLLEHRIRYGCAAQISVVAGQEPFFASPSDLSAHLLAACSGAPDEDCLGADTGNIRSNGVRSGWESILGDDIVLPVICGSVNPSGPTCNPDAVTDAGGHNTEYPIHKFVGARVCGFQFGNSGTFRSTTDNGCGGADLLATGNNNENYMIFIFDYVQGAGSINPSCSLGEVTCDGGARAVTLTE